MESMKGSWEVDDFANAECEAILDLVNCIAEMEGDLSG